MLEASQLKRVRLEFPLVAQTLDFTCGAACFESMVRYFRGESPGELHFAKELGTLELGYTAPERIVELARSLGFLAEMRSSAAIKDLCELTQNGEVVFVTWWDVDAGHYSLVGELNEREILLMDPWTARQGKWNLLKLDEFLPNWQVRGAKMIWIRPIRQSELAFQSGSVPDRGP